MMGATVLDGNALSRVIRARVGRMAAEFAGGSGRPVRLGIVIATEDAAARRYVRSIEKGCREVNIEARTVSLPATATEDEIRKELEALGRDPAAGGVDGIILQAPVPPGVDFSSLCESIDPRRDVDGTNPANAGRLWAGQPGFVPATPAAVMRLVDLALAGLTQEAMEKAPGGELVLPPASLAGLHAVVVGRSPRVGKPAAAMLLDRHATVTMAHSRTPDLRAVTSRADVLVVAAGRAGLVTGDMIKPGAVVIDVGTNVVDGALRGDVDFGSAAAVAGFLTPVPGGVGPVTMAILLEHVVAAALGRFTL